MEQAADDARSVVLGAIDERNNAWDDFASTTQGVFNALLPDIRYTEAA